MRKENKCVVYKTAKCKKGLYNDGMCNLLLSTEQHAEAAPWPFRAKDAILYATVRDLKWTAGSGNVFYGKKTLSSGSDYLVLFNVDGNIAMLEYSSKNDITPVILYRMVRDSQK